MKYRLSTTQIRVIIWNPANSSLCGYVNFYKFILGWLVQTRLGRETHRLSTRLYNCDGILRDFLYPVIDLLPPSLRMTDE